VKTNYDRELSVSGHRVKPASILHNSSLIMGKQIINVLPEGFVNAITRQDLANASTVLQFLTQKSALSALITTTQMQNCLFS
jgi:hypothetical protein